MSKVEVVEPLWYEAMKAKDKARKESLSMLLSALKNAEIDKRAPDWRAEENAVVKKEIKQTQETAYDPAPADREDIRSEAAQRLAVYEEFAPEDMRCGSDPPGDRRGSCRAGDRCALPLIRVRS